jgi:hypothetical protein
LKSLSEQVLGEMTWNRAPEKKPEESGVGLYFRYPAIAGLGDEG